MEGTLQNPAETLKQISPLARFAEIDASQFRQQVEQIGQSVEAVQEAVTSEVESGRLTPMQGLQWIACATGTAFGYAEFHGQPSAADLVLKAIASDNGQSQR